MPVVPFIEVLIVHTTVDVTLIVDAFTLVMSMMMIIIIITIDQAYLFMELAR